MFQSSSPLLRKSEPPVQVQDTIITAWTIRQPTRNRNDPIARAELYQLSYIPPEPSGVCMKESDASSILFPGAAGPSWTWTRDLAREVNHRPYDPTNWERINRLLFESDSSFPNAAYNSPLYCALQVCFFPLLPLTMASPWEITPMGRKRKALRDPPGPTLDTLRSFFKPALLPFKEKEFHVLPERKGGLGKSYWLLLSPDRREKHEKKARMVRSLRHPRMKGVIS